MSSLVTELSVEATADACSVAFDADAARGMPFPNPFDERPPGGPALTAANALLAQLRSGRPIAHLPSGFLEQPGGGAMFGVLVVETAQGRIGFLRAFADTLAGHWQLPGFVPPLFDQAQRRTVETEGAAEIAALEDRIHAARHSPDLLAARRAVEDMKLRQQTELDAIRQRHRERRTQRRTLRRTSDVDGLREELAAQSRADKAERRALNERHCRERDHLAAEAERIHRELRALQRLRDFVARRTDRRVDDLYRILDGNGRRLRLSELYGPRRVPAGAADCTAPKLLGYAYENGMRPIALTQFWFGAPPLSGGRISGVFYRACRTRCGPLLPFMLEGLNVASLAPYAPPPTDRLQIRIVFEDERIVVIDKPPGLLSVPSSNERITDSATARLQARHPELTGPLFVHRLDMDTSGLLIAALDADSHANLARQFAKRSIEKRYVAWLDGEVVGDEGTVDLALRGDLDDRPRHMHDPVGGKRAVTRWRVLARESGRTRVELRPVTGRTHQLRIHAAHPLGLGAPIVGDNLYGRGGERLMLHACMLRLRHPGTNEYLTVESPAPF